MSKSGRSNRVSLSRWWLVLVLVIAAALRFWQLSTLPPGLHPDEAQFGLAALADDPTGLPQMIASIFMRLGEATPWALRASSAFAGVLLVWGTYVAAAALFPPEPKKTNWLPVAAAFLTASFYPVLSFSRLGVGALWSAAFSTLAVACFWHGFNLLLTAAESDHSRHRSRLPGWWQRFTLSPTTYFGLTGVWLGAAAFSHEWGVLLGRFIILVTLVWAFRRTPSTGKYRPWLVVAGSFILTAILFRFLWGWPFDPLTVQWPSLNGFAQLFAGLFWSGSTKLAYNLPGRPFLDVLQAVLFLIGLGVTIRQGRHPRHLFLLFWLGVALLPALLTDDAGYWLVLPDAAAPLAILIAMGLSWLSDQLPVISNQSLKRPLPTGHWSLVTVYFFLLTSAFLTTRAYFSTYAQQPELAQEFAVDEWRLGQGAAAYPPETLLYLFPPSANQATIQFALPDPTRLWSFTPDESVLPLGRLETPVLYLVASEQTQLITQLAELFPEATVSDTPVDAYWSVYLPAFVPRLPQAHLTDLLWGGEIGLLDWQVARFDGGVEVSLYWQAAANPTQDYLAYLHLLDEQGQIVAQSQSALDGYPTGQWHTQEVVRGTLRLTTPPDGGSYQLVTGFLHPTTQTSLGEAILTTWP